MVHLAEIPFADFFLFQQTIDYPIIVRNIFVFVAVSEDDCVEIEKGKFVRPFGLKCADILAQTDEVAIEHDR
jgi:hypothetical protein